MAGTAGTAPPLGCGGAVDGGAGRGRGGVRAGGRGGRHPSPRPWLGRSLRRTCGRDSTGCWWCRRSRCSFAGRRHGRRRRWHVQRECELVGDDVPPGRILVCLLQHGTPSGCIGGVAPKTRRRTRLQRVAVPARAVRQDEARGVVSGRMRCVRVCAAHRAVLVPRPACVRRRPQPPATQLHQPRDVSCAHAARRHDAHAGHVQLYEVLARMHHDVRAPRYSPHTPRHDAVGDILPRVLYAEQHHMAAACADQEPGRRSRVWLPCETRALPRHVVVVTQAGHVDVAQTRRARIQTHAASCIDRR